MAETAEFENVTVVHETSTGSLRHGAILCRIAGEDKWVPKSLIDEDSEVYKLGTSGKLVLPVWWAEKEGLV